jgi:hypothetical protein
LPETGKQQKLLPPSTSCRANARRFVAIGSNRTAQVEPFAAGAGGTGSAIGKTGSHPLEQGGFNLKSRSCRDRNIQKATNIFGSPPVAVRYACAQAMRIVLAEERGADVVRALYNEDILAIRQSSGNPVIIGDEGGTVSLSRIGQQAEEMVGAEANSHPATRVALRGGRVVAGGAPRRSMPSVSAIQVLRGEAT